MSFRKHVYHVCGSPTSQFFYDLSLIYAQDTYLPSGWKEEFIVIGPDGRWRIGGSLSQLSQARAPRAVIRDLRRDAIVVPHLFCFQGMTKYRNFFENVLGYQMVGSSGEVMGIAANKELSRKRVQKHGVNIADGGLTTEIDVYGLQLPIVIKPNKEDNSVGLSLVTIENEIDKAIKSAEVYSGAVIAEQYIPGRELRIAVIETSRGYLIPPIIEYLVNAKNPIRKTSDKLKINPNGNPETQAEAPSVEMVCPASLDCSLYSGLRDQAIHAHKALGARDYSLFDFRIQEGTGLPFFLEAGLFWSFSKAGMITKMLQASDLEIEKLIGEIWDRHLTR